jgi:DNA (cytosine-5)-methyltransferase 1
MKVISLFSGLGSQELGLKYAGVENLRIIANCEISKGANIAYDCLHKTELGNVGDITKIDEQTFPECDLLTYSFPCQDISCAGKEKGIKVGTRSGLLFDVVRIIHHNKPKYLFMENVKNLVSKSHIHVFNNHIRHLESLGYGIAWQVFNSADFGCPQNRERVFMMCILGESSDFVKGKMNRVNEYKKERVSLRTILTPDYDESLIRDFPYEVIEQKRKSICCCVGIKSNWKFKSTGRIFSIDYCSPCLVTRHKCFFMMDDKKVRFLNERENYRLMGIREDDIDTLLNNPLLTKINHQSVCGNSICVPIMEAIFRTFFT